MSTPLDGPDINDLQAEILQTQQQLAEISAAHQKDQIWRSIFDSAPYAITIFEVSGPSTFHYITSNKVALRMLGIQKAAAHEGEAKISSSTLAEVQSRLAQCYAAGRAIEFDEHLVLSDRALWTQAIYAPIRMDNGQINQIMITSFDISERRQREIAEQHEREHVIQQQSSALAELSTPLLAISEHVVVLPLIGTVDSRRAQQIMDTLLSGIAATSAQIAILDITGVAVVDTQVANVLIHSAQAVKLLGAKVILTGIRPEVAQTLVGLGIDLSGIITRSTLQSGIAESLRLS